MKPTNDQSSVDDSAFFDSVFREHQKILFAYLLGQVGNRDHAEDLLQQVFVRVWRHIESARQKPSEAVRHWLFLIASNIAVDFRRSEMRRKSVPHASLEEVFDEKQDAEMGLIERESLARISKAIQNLPEDLRTAFTMSVLGEMNSEEVGMVLGKPAGTIRYQVSEARKRIAREVGL